MAADAPIAPQQMSVLFGTLSDSPLAAEATAPRTNPNCTAIVSIEVWPELSPHSLFSCETMNVAENQTLIENRVLTERTTNANIGRDLTERLLAVIVGTSTRTVVFTIAR